MEGFWILAKYSYFYGIFLPFIDFFLILNFFQLNTFLTLFSYNRQFKKLTGKQDRLPLKPTLAFTLSKSYKKQQKKCVYVSNQFFEYS